MQLTPITPEILETPEVSGSEFLTRLCGSILVMYQTTGATMPWLGYLARLDDEIVGTCAFKTPPSDGRVEIAYFTFPAYERRGIATRMAAQLVDIASAAGIRSIIAQTLPEPNASTHILEKLGFAMTGAVQHPEDGEVWEWERGGSA